MLAKIREKKVLDDDLRDEMQAVIRGVQGPLHGRAGRTGNRHMPSLLDIRRRIRSVRNTQQITKAMKMVSAAKLRRAQDRVIAARPYSKLLREVLGERGGGRRRATGARRANPLLAQRPEQRVLLVLVTADKGLAGAFNANLIKASQQFARERAGAAPAVAVDLELVGRKGRDFWRKQPGASIRGEHIGLSAKLDYAGAAAIARKSMERFASGEIDAVYLLYNEFKTRDVPETHPQARAAGGVTRAGGAYRLHLRAAAGGDAGGAAAALCRGGNLPARCWNRLPPNTPPA